MRLYIRMKWWDGNEAIRAIYIDFGQEWCRVRKCLKAKVRLLRTHCSIRIAYP